MFLVLCLLIHLPCGAVCLHVTRTNGPQVYRCSRRHWPHPLGSGTWLIPTGFLSRLRSAQGPWLTCSSLWLVELMAAYFLSAT